MKKTKRYIISTTETFLSAFLGTFFLQIETILNAWWFPNREILVSIIIASIIAWIKVLIKTLRESYGE